MLYGVQLRKTIMKEISPRYMENVLNTNKLSVSIPGTIIKPMIIGDNTFVFFD